VNQTNKPGVAAIITLGAIQILSWGGSFYLMAVMANPIAMETGWSQQWIYGALSTGILVSGLLAPLSGRIIARTGGRLLLAMSGAVMALGLVIMTFSYHLPLLLFAWVIIGVGMAMGLYDALFATLGTCYGAQARAAITGITLISGFCTTLVWPGTALLIHVLGWRGACLAIAGLLTLCVLPAYLYALPATRAVRPVNTRSPQSSSADIAPGLFWLLCAIFTLASVIMTAISVQLITLLQASGHTLTDSHHFFLGRPGGAWLAVAGTGTADGAAEHGALRRREWFTCHCARNFTAGDGQTRVLCDCGGPDGPPGVDGTGADAVDRRLCI